mgnify:CR=1 FL=1
MFSPSSGPIPTGPAGESQRVGRAAGRSGGRDGGGVGVDMQDQNSAAIIERDLADADTLGVRKTPGFFVNGKPLQPFGARPLAALIKAEIRAKYPE